MLLTVQGFEQENSILYLTHYPRYILKAKIKVSEWLQNRHAGLAQTLPTRWPWPAAELECNPQYSVTRAEWPAIYLFLGHF